MRKFFLILFTFVLVGCVSPSNNQPLTEQPTKSGWNYWTCYRITLGVPKSDPKTWQYGNGVLKLAETEQSNLTVLNIEYLIDPNGN
jgi:hypothetical protein